MTRKGKIVIWVVPELFFGIEDEGTEGKSREGEEKDEDESGEEGEEA